MHVCDIVHSAVRAYASGDVRASEKILSEVKDSEAVALFVSRATWDERSGRISRKAVDDLREPVIRLLAPRFSECTSMRLASYLPVVSFTDAQWNARKYAELVHVGAEYPVRVKEITKAAVAKIASKVDECEKPFRIAMLDDAAEIQRYLRPLIDANKDAGCHQISADFFTDVMTLAAFSTRGDREAAVAYLTFSYHDDYAPGSPIVHIEFACTDAGFRKYGLSQVLRCVVIEFAIGANARYITSDANKDSGAILRDKFGFTFFGADEINPQIGNMTGWKITATAVLDMSNADLSKYQATLASIESCLVPKT